jgi:hypothetical protein
MGIGTHFTLSGWISYHAFFDFSLAGEMLKSGTRKKERETHTRGETEEITQQPTARFQKLDQGSNRKNEPH